jgi:hypothetical protein
MGGIFEYAKNSWDKMLIVLSLLFWTYVLLSFIIRMFRDFREVNGSDATLYEETKISTQKFYSRIESAIGERQLSEIRLGRRYYREHLGISQKREYLAISYKKLLFLICAAPYGTGYFISFWSGEKMSFFKELTFSIPIYGPKLVNIIFRKTYFELDTEAMFRTTVRGCLDEAVKDTISNKGTRDSGMGIPHIVKNGENVIVE